MAYWDFTEYTWALENLRDNLAPAFTRSCCFFTAWYVCLFSPSFPFQHPPPPIPISPVPILVSVYE
jgi:hypothetical protein